MILVLTEDANNPPLPLQRIYPEKLQHESDQYHSSSSNSNYNGKGDEDFDAAEAKSPKVSCITR